MTPGPIFFVIPNLLMFAWIMIRQQGVFAVFFGRPLDDLGSLAMQTPII
jgi:hypothetical protein